MHSVEASCVQSSTQTSRLSKQIGAVAVPFWSVTHTNVTVPNVKFFNFQVGTGIPLLNIYSNKGK